MDLATVVAVGATCAGLAAFAGWRGSRPPDPMKGPRLMPWRLIMLLGAAAAVAMVGIGLRTLGIHPPGQ